MPTDTPYNTTPSPASLHLTLEQLQQWGDNYNELVKLEIRLCELRQEMLACQSHGEPEQHFLRAIRRELVVLRYQVFDLKEKLKCNC